MTEPRRSPPRGLLHNTSTRSYYPLWEATRNGIPVGSSGVSGSTTPIGGATVPPNAPVVPPPTEPGASDS